MTCILAIICDFESGDFCDFGVYGSGAFNFSVKQGQEFANSEEGPQTDDEGNTSGHFAYIKSGLPGITETSSAIIETQMIHGANHLIECFEFSIAMMKDGGLRSITVIQQDEELDADHGEIVELWSYTSEQVNNSDWFIGRVETRAHYHDEIPQNYTVS